VNKSLYKKLFLYKLLFTEVDGSNTDWMTDMYNRKKKERKRKINGLWRSEMFYPFTDCYSTQLYLDQPYSNCVDRDQQKTENANNILEIFGSKLKHTF